MIKIAAILHIILTLIQSGIQLVRGSSDLALCQFIVSSLILINFMGVVFLVYWLIRKKTIALPLVIIILKYPIVIAAIMILSHQNWVTPVGVYLSVTTFVFSFVAAYFYIKARGQNAF